MTKTVLCFGDSNTHGTLPITDWATRGRLDHHLRWTTLLEQAVSGIRVIGAGQPGRTTVHDDPIEGAHKNGLTALPMLLESHGPLDLVVVMLGTNDCKARFSVGPADIARSVDRLLGVIAQAECGPDGTAPKTLVMAPVPIREVGLLAPIFAGGAAKSEALAAPLAEVSAGRDAWFLDAGLHADTSPVDGIHLTAEANASLAAALARLVRRCLA